ncbi:MAG: hypothetical protein IPK82_05665 [Polyangiaceae bacterium]|nr:hypothetical protein [Polyangiaceae bacterium]
MLRFALLGVFCVAIAGCNNPQPDVPPQPPPPDRPPTPESVTKNNPGGDAPDPVKAALQRLLSEPFEAKRKDRWNTLRVPLADWKNWRRIKILGHPTRATFQYGDDHIAMALIRYSPIEGENTPERCLADFIKYSTPIAESYGVRLGTTKLVNLTQNFRGETRPILVRLQEGGIDSVFTADDYVGFLAAYQSWPGTCLVQGGAVLATDHPELAAKVRDRWVNEAVGKLAWERKIKEAPDPSKMR